MASKMQKTLGVMCAAAAFAGSLSVANATNLSPNQPSVDHSENADKAEPVQDKAQRSHRVHYRKLQQHLTHDRM